MMALGYAGWVTLSAVFVLTASVSIAVCVPLAWLDDGWVGRVNTWAAGVLGKSAAG